MMLVAKKIKKVLCKAKLLKKENSDPIKIKKTSTGMTNENYICVLSNGEQLVVRFPGNGTSDMISRKDECQNQNLIAGLGLNADVLFFDDESGIKVSRYIEDIFAQNQSTYNKIPEVCKGLKKLHNSGTHFKNRFCFFEKIESYETILYNRGHFLCRDYLEIKNKILKHQQKLYSNVTWKSCHNDPVLENFLMDGCSRIYLIDWEYSGMNDPLWDIASFALENGLNEEEEAYLWNCYWDGQYPTPAMLEKIKLFKVCQDLLWHVWAKIKESQGEDLFSYAEMRLKRAIHSLALNPSLGLGDKLLNI
ncbi:choline kinase [Pedobacter psychrodurus]|uniref:Choline kinase n=1 Tax=Pedobacter psychrodurus TaxID=2530456 RepID=A0A4R0PXY3_9SPHI|nr:choline kinase family protein [Pedobacter psychrodurus]TCD27793.1 choline kinase [Pedobacter psychrodurus]